MRGRQTTFTELGKFDLTDAKFKRFILIQTTPSNPNQMDLGLGDPRYMLEETKNRRVLQIQNPDERTLDQLELGV